MSCNGSEFSSLQRRLELADLDHGEDVLPDVGEPAHAKTNRLDGFVAESGVDVSSAFKASLVKDFEVRNRSAFFST